jgi:hypothetical protein
MPFLTPYSTLRPLATVTIPARNAKITLAIVIDSSFRSVEWEMVTP